MHHDAEALTGLILEALRELGGRAIIQRGWAGLARHALPEGVLAVDFVPHSWLFPRAACVVHHGGAGTTAAAFRAGVPAVIVPHTLEQPLWAEFSRALGCTVSVIPFQQLSAASLVDGLRRMLASDSCRAATAASVGEKVRTAPSVRRARELLKELVASRRRV